MRHMEAFRKGNSQREFHQSFRLQSAMEYLMTYGWAILIIAVVLAALFELGVFNPITFAPKASPGSCQVVRPEGTGTTDFISLSGECNGELPQYAAQFNGQNGYIIINGSDLPTGSKPRTVIAWFLDFSPLQSRDIFSITINNGCITGGGTYFETNVGQYYDNAELNAWCTNDAFPMAIQKNQWYFIAYAYNGTYQKGWLGGYNNLVNISAPYAYNTPQANFQLGNGDDGPPNFWNGSIANVQVYNTALSANDIQALYQGGIGGAPIDLQSLVGWWPLNGNANDYSGNGNNGVPTGGVSYTSNWYFGYSAP